MSSSILIQIDDPYECACLCVRDTHIPCLSTEGAWGQQHPSTDEHTLLCAAGCNSTLHFPVSPWPPVFKVCGYSSFLVLWLVAEFLWYLMFTLKSEDQPPNFTAQDTGGEGRDSGASTAA